jgi:hypothetical protein
VTAVTPARAIRLSAEGFTGLMAGHPQLGVQVSTLLAQSMLQHEVLRRRGRLLAVVADQAAPAEALVAAIHANATGTVEVLDARRVAGQAPDSTAAMERMIATGQLLDRLTASADILVVTFPSDLDAAYARPLFERTDLVLVAPDDDERALRRRLREMAGASPPQVLRLDPAPAGVQVVFNRLGRPHEVSVFVPTTVDVDQTCDPAQHVHRAKVLFGECFGGATVREAEGVWMSDDLGLVGERILMVTAACDEVCLNAHLDRVTAFLLELKETLRQEAMAMRVDGRLILL